MNVTDKFCKIWKKSWPVSIYYLRLLPEGLRKTMRNLSQDFWSQAKNANHYTAMFGNGVHVTSQYSVIKYVLSNAYQGLFSWG
jgi:hypothetical protein